jgi:hypothetical protein
MPVSAKYGIISDMHANYAALKDYEALVLPKPASKIEVKNETTLRTEVVRLFEGVDAPTMVPRELPINVTPLPPGKPE